MQRAPCARIFSSGKSRYISNQSLTRCVTGRRGACSRAYSRKPVSLPMLHLLGLDQRVQRRAGNVGLASATYPQHSLVFVREDFDKPRQRLRPVVENPSRARAAGEFQMPRHEISYKLRFRELSILRFENRFEVNRIEIAALFGEVSTLVKHVGDASTHTGGKISATSSEDKHQALGHVFAAMVSDSLDHGGRPGIANGKALARDAVEKRLAARRAVEGNVANENILFRSEG